MRSCGRSCRSRPRSRWIRSTAARSRFARSLRRSSTKARSITSPTKRTSARSPRIRKGFSKAATRSCNGERLLGYAVARSLPPNTAQPRNCATAQPHLSVQVRLERAHDLGGAAHRLARFEIEPDVRAEPVRAPLASLAVEQLVRELHQPASHLPDRRADQHLVVVAKRRAVAAADFRHDEELSAPLDLRVRNTGRAAEVRAADLEPDEVIRMMGDPHLVGLFVAHARS